MNVTVNKEVNTEAPDLDKKIDINKIWKGSHILNNGDTTDWMGIPHHNEVRPRIQILGWMLNTCCNLPIGPRNLQARYLLRILVLLTGFLFHWF
jgi:hypothetical protein